MKYVCLIYQGTTPLPGMPAWDELSPEEQKAVYDDYAAVTQHAGVTPGPPLGRPDDATTVRVQGGRTLTTDGPFASTKEAGRLLRGRGGAPRRSDRGGRTGPGGSPGRRHRDQAGRDLLVTSEKGTV